MRTALMRLEPKIDLAATASAIAVLPLIFVEQSATDTATLRVAMLANWLIWLIFLADVAIKWSVFGRTWLRTGLAWFEIAIVVLSFPLLGELLASLRLARLSRVGRLARTTRLLRFSFAGLRALQGLKRILDPRALPFVSLSVLLIVALGAATEYLVEFGPHQDRGFGDSLWWAVSTVTTVGYGDIAPSTFAGRLVAVAVMVIGIAFTSLLTAQIAAYLVREEAAAESDELTSLKQDVDRLATALERIEARLRD